MWHCDAGRVTEGLGATRLHQCVDVTSRRDGATPASSYTCTFPLPSACPTSLQLIGANTAPAQGQSGWQSSPFPTARIGLVSGGQDGQDARISPDTANTTPTDCCHEWYLNSSEHHVKSQVTCQASPSTSQSVSQNLQFRRRTWKREGLSLALTLISCVTLAKSLNTPPMPPLNAKWAQGYPALLCGLRCTREAFSTTPKWQHWKHSTTLSPTERRVS